MGAEGVEGLAPADLAEAADGALADLVGGVGQGRREMGYGDAGLEDSQALPFSSPLRESTNQIIMRYLIYEVVYIYVSIIYIT